MTGPDQNHGTIETVAAFFSLGGFFGLIAYAVFQNLPALGPVAVIAATVLTLSGTVAIHRKTREQTYRVMGVRPDLLGSPESWSEEEQKDAAEELVRAALGLPDKPESGEQNQAETGDGDAK